jgi:predicted SAM-dependent methyltransferase
MLEYLQPGGLVRTAVPSFGSNLSQAYKDNQNASYTHVTFHTMDTLVALLRDVGFSKVIVREGRYNHTHAAVFSGWDRCDGMIRRSMKYDSRNHDKRFDVTEFDKFNEPARTIFPTKSTTFSLIVDAYK